MLGYNFLRYDKTLDARPTKNNFTILFLLIKKITSGYKIIIVSFYKTKKFNLMHSRFAVYYFAF